MAGTFFGLETASRALRANQAVLDVIGHNISNVDTPGFSRQTTELRPTDPYRSNIPGMSVLALGTGVEVSSISRVRDEFVERRLNDSLADQGKYRQLSDTLSRVQTMFNDPGDAGLNASLTTFFNSFQDVARHPESVGPRTIVLHNADDVAKHFRDVFSSLTGTRLEIGEHVKSVISQVNDLAKQIAGLNTEIQKAISLGGQPNDLSDRRDGLVQQLTQLVGATVVEEQDGKGNKTGSVNVSVGGIPLVQGPVSGSLPVEFGIQKGQAVLISGKDKFPVISGELAGLIQADDNVKSYLADVNALASKLITTVNAQHKGGYGLNGETGLDFFSGTDASNIAVNTVIAGNPEAIAAASPPSSGTTPAAGNGDNARALANIASQALFGTMTLQDRYAQTVTRVGADAKSYDQQATNQGEVTQQLSNLRSSVSGVSMDEELTKMLAYQRAYQSAARLVSTYDEVIQSLLAAFGK